MSANSLFISKDPGEISELLAFSGQHDLQVIAHSFLHFEAVPFIVQNDYDVVFFGSRNAVKYFLDQEKANSSKVYAAVGQATANELGTFGFTAAFIGEGSNINEIARSFKEWCGKRSILFPQSDISLRTISGVFDKKQKEDLVVYRSIRTTKTIPACNYYVFTSPSNAEAFLQTNQIPERSTVLSWGSSTADFLADVHIQSVKLEHPSVNELIVYLRKSVLS